MIAALTFLALLQGDQRPGTLPPEAELADRSSLIGRLGGLGFVPSAGGLLVVLDRNESLTMAHTSDSGLIVNMRTGELNYIAAPDYIDRQILCPSALFVRSYRSELAKLGKHSPGLPPGWVHNYDLIIKLPSGTEKWEPITLTYPNKAQEQIQPDVDENGAPTGKAHSLSNATYQISVVPGQTVNTYQSVSITWPNSRTTWDFETHASGVMVLRAINDGSSAGHLRLSYHPDRTLASVTWLEHDMKMLSFNYSNDYLATMVTRGDDYTIGYTDTVLGDKLVLYKVSAPFKNGENPHDAYVYSYATDISYPALTQIAIPDGNTWSKSVIEYTNGKISAVQGAGGVRQLVGS